MILEAGIENSFDNDDFKLLNLLVENYAKENTYIDVDIEVLKKEMEQDNIPTSKFDARIENLEKYKILKNHSLQEYHWITLHSQIAKMVLQLLKQRA